MIDFIALCDQGVIPDLMVSEQCEFTSTLPRTRNHPSSLGLGNLGANALRSSAPLAGRFVLRMLTLTVYSVSAATSIHLGGPPPPPLLPLTSMFLPATLFRERVIPRTGYLSMAWKI